MEVKRRWRQGCIEGAEAEAKPAVIHRERKQRWHRSGGGEAVVSAFFFL
jgi:hypothetical protein